MTRATAVLIDGLSDGTSTVEGQWSTPCIGIRRANAATPGEMRPENPLAGGAQSSRQDDDGDRRTEEEAMSRPASVYCPRRRAILTSAAALLELAIVTACAPTTEIVASWRHPNATAAEMQRPLVAFLHQDVALRFSVEDEMAARIPNAVPAYNVIDVDEIRDWEKARAKIREAGFDSVIVTRLVDVDKEVEYVPGTYVAPPYYGALWGPGLGYWGYGWGAVYDPGYLTTTTVVTLETLIYSLGEERGELMWASRSETFDPSSADNLVRSVISASAEEMRKEGFLTTSR